MPPLTINLAEPFPWLAKAPIIEAVIDLRARAEVELNNDALRNYLRAKLPEYPEIQSQREVHFQVTLGDEGTPGQLHPAKWRGVRLTSADKLHVAQFNRDGFVFSRLTPYENWDNFCSEAMRLWNVHAEFAKPSEIQRLGARFINRMPIAGEPHGIRDVLSTPPKPPQGLDVPTIDYVRQDTYAVPGYPYGVRRVQTIQPLAAGGSGIAAILDIDVFTTEPCGLSTAALQKRLAEMRWLKNKVFFGSVTSRAIKRFQEGPA